MARINLTILCVCFVACFGRFSSGDFCTSLNSTEVLPCGNQTTIFKDPCLANGCCWNESKIDNDTGLSCYRAKKYNGTCIKYPEDGICFKYLNMSVPQYRDTPRFIDYSIGLNQTNELLARFQNLITVVGKNEMSESCLNTVRILLCQYILTPCLEDGSFIQICRRDCDMYETQCPDTLQKLLGGASLILHSTQSNFVHIPLPDCRKLEYEKDLAKVGKKCYLTGLFNNKESSGSEDDNNVIIIASVVVIFLVLVLVILLTFLLHRRRRNRKEQAKLEPGTPSMNLRVSFPAVSVKDHINMLTAEDLLKSKMSVNDVKKIRQFPVDRVAYEKDLGEGQFGQVFQGRAIGLNDDNPDAEVIVAVKTLKKGSSHEAKQEFDEEACRMNFLFHPNIVRLLAVSAMEEPYCMIFEFMSNGDLSEYLRKSQPLEDDTEPDDENKNRLSQATLIHMCTDIARGLKYLASHRLVHRDVATRNCLVADDLTIKIADFGMSRDIYSNNYYKIEKETVLPIRWLSPEAVLFGKFTIESDTYSYGVLLWEVFTFSKQPYYGYTNKEVLEFIAKGIHLAKPDFCPDFVYPVMKKCWSKDPELRPDYNKIIDALNGDDIIEEARTREEQKAQPEYQNFVPFSNETINRASSSSSGNQNDPLIKSQEQRIPGENPVYKRERSNSGSQGSFNSALESDSEISISDGRTSINDGRTNVNVNNDGRTSRTDLSLHKTYV
ncbi:insulin-like growth factor 1 receptor [Dendronephthya gigantea]|uniref:insulin-like growth factor 1 receptor n=1 Tax=Dendronephthya gigantea TaxID=151771 RepID=UPI00106CA8F9|nr:insulin-like growth factor 1 receptor [Dendronephthya gigantea]